MSNAPVPLAVPAVGESVTEVEVGAWLKQPGDAVRRDEPVVVLETDKATVEIPSPVDGRVGPLLRQKGERVRVGEILGHVEPGAGPAASPPAAPPAAAAAAANTPAPASIPTPDPTAAPPRVMPAAARLAAEQGVKVTAVTPTGPGGRLLKEDVQRAVESGVSAPAVPASPPPSPVASPAPAATAPPTVSRPAAEDRVEEVLPMSLLRRKIAERLVEAQHSAALLTTFNEVDMSTVMGLRREHQERFVERYQVKLGFMSFFVKASVEALKETPQLNAELRGTNVVYRNYQDIGVAIGGGKGLVVPVIRHAERLSFAEIEQAIAEFGKRARESRIRPDELVGGTFTITNGGVYGSLLSTPIINPPQSGVLGMHSIQDRPVASNGQVVIRPMMYVALTYDHRIVDGREAVTFLKRVKEYVENPVRMLIEI